MDYFVTNNSLAPAPMGIQSTAGAVPIKNDKGTSTSFLYFLAIYHRRRLNENRNLNGFSFGSIFKSYVTKLF